MARIARLYDDFFVNFEDHCLYSNGCRIVELNKRPLDVLEYLCSYPNCYKSVDDINNYLEAGCLSASAVRGYVYSLRSYHPVLKEVVTSNKSGYKYTGYKIINIDIPADREGAIPEHLMVDLLKKEHQIKPTTNDVIMSGACIKGAYTSDEMQQNVKKREEKTELAVSVTNFVDETNLTTESNIDFFEDDKRLTRILNLACKIKIELSDSNDESNIFAKLIDNRVDSYIESMEICLCIRDCGKFLGQNIINESVISNPHFLDYLARYAKKHGYEIDKSEYIGDTNKIVALFIEVLESPEGTKEFLDGLFYGIDKILVRMQEEKKQILETFQKYMINEKIYMKNSGDASEL